jgi:site-specific DNA-methyltransferase (adenine-specific)
VRPYYDQDGITIYHGDCREILQQLEMGSVDLVLTDPPYGISYRTPPSAKRPKSGMSVVGDNEPFDPAHLLHFPRLAVFGANHYADRLPSSAGWIVWDKRYGMPSNDQSDAELMWTNCLGSVRIVRCLWNGGGSLLAENGPARCIHPTQKPLKLMRVLVEMLSEPEQTILDPYCGTGTTLRAAKDLGRKAIGIEIEERYCEIAAKRLAQSVLPLCI